MSSFISYEVIPFRNISTCFEKKWANSAHWAIQGKRNLMRGYNTSCAILFGIDLKAGPHIFVSAIHNLQNEKEENSSYQLEKKIRDLPFSVRLSNKSIFK